MESNLVKVILKERFLFILLSVFAVFIFFYKLNSIPNGFYIDEALPGYNAYSILKTGKDEYGKFLPIVFRFYGSYNPPLYTYLTVPFVKLLGLSVYSVRFISALCGLLSCFILLLILKKLEISNNKYIAYIGSFLFAASPWIILHSRVGYEVSLALLLFSTGVLLLWLSLKDKRYLVPSIIFFNFSTYAAYTERFIAPLFLLGVFFMFRQRLLGGSYKATVKKAAIISLILQIPNFYLLTTPAFFPKTNLLSTNAIVQQATKIYLPQIISIPLAFIREFLSQYLTYFSPRSLFFIPDPDIQRSIPELSTFYFWMIIPYLTGLYLLWMNKSKGFAKFILLLLLITPLPASLTRDPFSIHRALPLALPMILVISMGIGKLIVVLPKYLFLCLFVFFSSFSLLLLWRSYFVLLPNERAGAWGYGVDELSNIILENPETKFVVDQSRKKPLYMNLAFFMKYPPRAFQKIAGERIENSYYENVNFDPNYSFANVELRNIIWEKDVYKYNIIVGDELAVSKDQIKEHFLSKVFEIDDPLGKPVFIGYQTNPRKKCGSIDFSSEACRRLNF